MMSKSLLIVLLYMKEYSGFKIPLYNYGESLITFSVKPYVSDVKSYLEWKQL